MKNLSKKIGVGVVASSLVVGGAVSTGLVANANTINQTEIGQSQLEIRQKKLNRVGDLELFKGLKEKYQFKVYGYYLLKSEQEHTMPSDIENLLEWCQGRINNKTQDKDKYQKKYQKIKSTLEEKDIPEKFKFDDAKHFLWYILENGMKKGIEKIQIGDAISIIVFEKDIEPQKDWKNNLGSQEEVSSDKEWQKYSNYINKWIDVNLLDKIQESWLGCSLEIKKDIQENDPLWILGENPDHSKDIDILEIVE